MSFTDVIHHLFQGIGSALSQASMLKDILSSAIADGLEAGINRSMPVLMKYIALGGVFVTGIFLFGWGTVVWVESMVATTGLGFILVGFLLFGVGIVYLQTKK